MIGKDKGKKTGKGKSKKTGTEIAPCIASKDINELNLMRCPECKSIHFRHAGNVLTFRQYDYHSKKHQGEVDTAEHFVYVCIGCGKPWIKVGDEMFDATEEIDVVKFDKMNAALEKDTKTSAHC